jgi:hypothetical protein
MYEQRPPQQDEHFGCLDALLITRIVFGVLLWPMLFIAGAVIAGVIVLLMFTIHPALVLIPAAVIALGVWLFARWERSRPWPPDGPPPNPPHEGPGA